MVPLAQMPFCSMLSERKPVKRIDNRHRKKVRPLIARARSCHDGRDWPNSDSRLALGYVRCWRATGSAIALHPKLTFDEVDGASQGIKVP
jgi:hypothetical protein